MFTQKETGKAIAKGQTAVQQHIAGHRNRSDRRSNSSSNCTCDTFSAFVVAHATSSQCTAHTHLLNQYTWQPSRTGWRRATVVALVANSVITVITIIIITTIGAIVIDQNDDDNEEGKVHSWADNGREKAKG